MGGDRFQASLLPGGVHHGLQQLAGQWEGMTRTWFTPGELADESMWRGTIRPVLGGRFMLYEYTGSISGDPLEGLAIIGYNLARSRYEMAWVDSFHNGTNIMFAEGGPGFAMLGHYDAPEGPPWGWRTEVELQGADRLVITAYNILPSGEEAKAVETIYTRKG